MIFQKRSGPENLERLHTSMVVAPFAEAIDDVRVAGDPADVRRAPIHIVVTPIIVTQIEVYLLVNTFVPSSPPVCAPGLWLPCRPEVREY